MVYSSMPSRKSALTSSFSQHLASASMLICFAVPLMSLRTQFLLLNIGAFGNIYSASSASDTGIPIACLAPIASEILNLIMIVFSCL